MFKHDNFFLYIIYFPFLTENHMFFIFRVRNIKRKTLQNVVEYFQKKKARNKTQTVIVQWMWKGRKAEAVEFIESIQRIR